MHDIDDNDGTVCSSPERRRLSIKPTWHSSRTCFKNGQQNSSGRDSRVHRFKFHLVEPCFGGNNSYIFRLRSLDSLKQYCFSATLDHIQTHRCTEACSCIITALRSQDFVNRRCDPECKNSNDVASNSKSNHLGGPIMQIYKDI
jgi:hypothetical protein